MSTSLFWSKAGIGGVWYLGTKENIWSKDGGRKIKFQKFHGDEGISLYWLPNNIT